MKRYRCDYSMAVKKNIRRHCDRKCNQCLCGISIDAWGREEHVPDMIRPCGNFTLRNLNVMSGRYYEQQAKGETR